MNKVDKFIRKCRPNERYSLLEDLERIRHNDLAGFDIKKLKGYDNYFRIRKGRVRIIFSLDINGLPVIKEIEYRNDNTY